MKKKKEKILVTSALPYANGPLHLGHIAGAYMPADVYVRFNRLLGNDVIFIGGTDEYGVPITLTAEKEKTTPAEIAKKYHENIKKTMQTMQISYDNFSGTAREVHNKISQDFFLSLKNNGYVVKKAAKQFYCSNDKMFLPDRYIEGTCPKCGYENARGDECPACGSWLDESELKNPRCALCGSSPSMKETEHWFLKLNEMQNELEEWIKNKENWKDNVLNLVKGWFKSGLRERAITRDLSWGIPVPIEGSEGKVLYVWFDAPIGYISSTVEWSEKIGEPDKWKEYWLNKDTKLIHFIGKDNIPFHTLIWPAILMGHSDSYILPYDVPANEHLTIEGQKLSTSRGNVVWVDDAVKKYPVDYIRYYIASNAPEKKDADFSWKEFQMKINTDLNDIFGNLINRTFTFIANNYESIVPKKVALSDDDKTFLKKCEDLYEKVHSLYSNFKVREATSTIMDIARASNKYFDACEPWKLVKTDKEKCGTVLNLLCQAIRMLATILYPVIPSKTAELYSMFGINSEILAEGWKEFDEYEVTGIKLTNVKRLFDKIDDKIIREEIEGFYKKMEELKVNQPVKETKKEITFEEFKNIELKVAKIIEAVKIEKSKKLLKLQVEIGNEKRQIVAGIAEYYQPENLIGKSVIVVANLKEAKLMGELSQGMILAAKNSEEGLCVLTPEKPLKSGSEVS